MDCFDKTDMYRSPRYEYEDVSRGVQSKAALEESNQPYMCLPSIVDEAILRFWGPRPLVLFSIVKVVAVQLFVALMNVKPSQNGPETRAWVSRAAVASLWRTCRVIARVEVGKLERRMPVSPSAKLVYLMGVRIGRPPSNGRRELLVVLNVRKRRRIMSDRLKQARVRNKLLVFRSLPCDNDGSQNRKIHSSTYPDMLNQSVLSRTKIVLARR